MSLRSEVWRIIYYFRHELTFQNLKMRGEYKKRLEKLKDIHKNKRCFVIGNGPSLTAEDLELLNNEVTFAANRIFYIFDKTSWRPTYYCAQDPTVIEDCAVYFPSIVKSAENLFFINSTKKYLPDSVRNDAKTMMFYARLVSAHKERKFSDNIARYIDGGGTITYTAIQLAVYMGFKEIYLLGVDNNYSASSFNNGTISSEDVKKSYFAGMPSNIKLNKPNTDVNTQSFLAAKDYCDKHGILIRNATRGGMLELFGREKLETIVGGNRL